MLSADGVDRRLVVFGRAQAPCWIYLQLPGATRDGAARPARTRPDDRLRAAADLGEHAQLSAGPDSRFHTAQAQDVRFLSASGRTCRTAQRRGKAGSAADAARFGIWRDP